MIASRSRQHVPAVAVGIAVAVAAGAISISRLLLSNASALSDLVWAEDGLFPLCAKAHNPILCAAEPYAGYLILLPRLVAWPVSLVPMSSWPAATNIAAAVLAAATAGAVIYILRASGSGWICSIIVAVLPVAAPIMGVEAINSTANSYVLLPFVACLALCLPPPGRLPRFWYAAGALLAALTIPSSVVLLLPLAVHVWRRHISRRDAAVVGAAILMGVAVQATAVMSATTSRRPGLSWSSLQNFADVLPSIWLTNWPFYEWTFEAGEFVPVPLAVHGFGMLVVALATVVSIVLIARGGYAASAVGLLIACGLGFAIIPAVLLASANTRYYVLLVLLWTAAGLIAFDRVLRGTTHLLAMVAATVVVALLWVPNLPAQPYRATADPPWTSALVKVKFACLENPRAAVTLEFSPRWPSPSTGLAGLTTNVVPCSAIERSLLDDDDK